MDQFVCVRLVQANRLDLTLFQFDYDLTFAALFMNADGTIYGRYGSRSERQDAEKDISIEGFGKAMGAAIEIHRQYSANKPLLAGKQPRPVKFSTPEEFPSLADKYPPFLDYSGNVVRSCLHCHQIRDAERAHIRSQQKPLPDDVLFPYPMPSVIGLALDPADNAMVLEVAPGSAASAAGFQPGDRIIQLDEQLIFSTADVQWVLHHASDGDRLSAQVMRADELKSLLMELPSGWRMGSDISWRTTTWDLRRMVTGGLVLEDLPDQDREVQGRAKTNLALRVKHVGQYGQHAAAKRAGFKQDDLIISVSGTSNRISETQLIRQLIQNHATGARVPVTVLRQQQTLTLELPMQ